MRIAILADPIDNQSAGVHTYTRNLVEYLSGAKSEHEIIVLRQKKGKPIQNIEEIIIPNVYIPVISAAIRMFVIFPLVLRIKNVDVVIEPAHFGPFNLPKSVKRITVIHDLTPLKFPEYHRWHSQIAQRLFLRRILKKSDLIITNSESTSKDLEEFFPFTENKNHPILLGKDSIYKPTFDQNLLQRFKLGNPYFLCVGTIEPRKNLTRVISAFKEFLESENKDALLAFVGGKGWKNDKFEASINSFPHKENLRFLGYVDNAHLPVLYSHCISLVYPSLYEGFGLPILEAMSCGAPVICSNLSSMPEVGGDAALYVDPESEEEIFKAMKTIYNLGETEKEELKLAVKNQAANFSWEKFGNEWISCLESL